MPQRNLTINTHVKRVFQFCDQLWVKLIECCIAALTETELPTSSGESVLLKFQENVIRPHTLSL